MKKFMSILGIILLFIWIIINSILVINYSSGLNEFNNIFEKVLAYNILLLIPINLFNKRDTNILPGLFIFLIIVCFGYNILSYFDIININNYYIYKIAELLPILLGIISFIFILDNDNFIVKISVYLTNLVIIGTSISLIVTKESIFFISKFSKMNTLLIYLSLFLILLTIIIRSLYNENVNYDNILNNSSFYSNKKQDNTFIPFDEVVDNKQNDTLNQTQVNVQPQANQIVFTMPVDTNSMSFQEPSKIITQNDTNNNVVENEVVDTDLNNKEIIVDEQIKNLDTNKQNALEENNNDEIINVEDNDNKNINSDNDKFEIIDEFVNNDK